MSLVRQDCGLDAGHSRHGHLLLGSGSHARTGIMQSRWDRKQIRQATTGRLLFSEEESQRMKREVIARAELHEPHR